MMPIDAADLSVQWPRGRLPIFFIVNDPAPCLNLAHYEQYFERHVRDVPNSFTQAWADLVQESGMRGKFSVLPYPAALGPITQPLPDVPPAEQETFLRIIREQVAPRFDICPEILTHFQALDLKTGRVADYTEKTMGRFHTRASLAEYIAYGLRLLHEVGLDATGVTSPGYFGLDIEPTYARATGDALREVGGLSVAWYFLHVDLRSPLVPPRLMHLDTATGEAIVAIVSGGNDPSWRTQAGLESDLDSLITADGQQGRLVELARAGSVIGFHTHWQSLFSEGRATGLAGLRETLRRIKEHLGQRVVWMTCSALARYTAAWAALRTSIATAEEGTAPGVRLTHHSAFACPEMTFRLVTEQPIAAVRVNDVPLRRLREGEHDLAAGTWQHRRDGLWWSAALPAGTQHVVLSTALDQH